MHESPQGSGPISAGIVLGGIVNDLFEWSAGLVLGRLFFASLRLTGGMSPSRVNSPFAVFAHRKPPAHTISHPNRCGRAAMSPQTTSPYTRYVRLPHFSAYLSTLLGIVDSSGSHFPAVTCSNVAHWFSCLSAGKPELYPLLEFGESRERMVFRPRQY
jgi:hypothetical protein